jgi:cell division septal protein FtsQ
MHAPASVTGARRRLTLPAALRRGPGIPGGRPAAAAAACLAGLALLLALILVYTPIAHPKTLVVDGVTGPSKTRITRLLEEAGATQSTFAVDRDALMRAVGAYPEVSGVEVNSHPPFRLEIRAIMRPPVGRVEIGGRAFVIAADGTILQRAAGADVPKFDASISGVSIRQGRLAGAPAALDILAAAPQELLAIARTVRTGHAGIEIEMSRGPRLVFGTGAQAADKWAAAAAVIADGSADAATYIDLRVPSRPAVGGIGGTKSASAEAAPPTLTATTGATATAPGTSSSAAPQTGATTTSTGTAAGTTAAAGAGTTGTATDAGTTTGTSSGAPTTGTGNTGAATPATGTTTAPQTSAPAAGTSTGAATSNGGGAAIAPTP